MTTRFRSLPLVLLCLLAAACSDRGPTTPTTIEPPEERPTLSFSYSGDRAGSFEAIGEVALNASRTPTFGTWSAALLSSGDSVNMSIAAARAGTTPLADVFLLVLHRIRAPGTYELSSTCSTNTTGSCAIGLFSLGYRWDSRTPPPDAEYRFTAGTVTVTAVDSDRIRGSFQISGPRVRPSGDASLTVTSGRFNVPIVPNATPLARALTIPGFEL